MAEKTFMKITNRDIYNKLEKWEERATELIKTNTEAHQKIVERLDITNSKVDITNGKVKLSTKIGMAAMGLTIILLGFLFTHISTKP